MLFDKLDSQLLNSILMDFNGTDDNFKATVFEDDQCRYCLLSYIDPDDNCLSFAAQTDQIFERIDTALADFDMNFHDVVRTWFYLKDILRWYDDFNTARNNFFTRKGIFGKRVPASTGIGISNYPYALTCRILAIKPKTDKVKITEVTSPLQCAATDYRSAFARATLISSDSDETLLVSGTAAINPDGHTAHIDDIKGQIDLTFKVTDEILRAQQMNRNNINRAIAYFREERYIQNFLQYTFLL